MNKAEANTVFNGDILRLHTLYLEKLEHLSKGEREAYEAYLKYLGRPAVTAGAPTPNAELLNIFLAGKNGQSR